MLIKITVKRCLMVLFAIFLGIYFYLHSINYFFDKKLERLANPLLKEVMRVEYYRIDKSEVCPMFGAQMNADIVQVLQNLDLKSDVVTTVAVNDCLSQVMRMNGDEKTDSAFNNKDAIKCNTEKGYAMLKQLSQSTKSMFEKSENFRFYSLYVKSDCLNHNISEQNFKKYPNQMFGTKVNTLTSLPVGRFWIIKHGHYFYLIAQTNGLQGHIQNEAREQYLIFKKLTRDELMSYDNGSYGKLIREYGIKID